MILSWHTAWAATQGTFTYHREEHGYRIYSDEVYLYLVDMDGNVGVFDAEDTPYEDFEDWVNLAFSQIDLA